MNPFKKELSIGSKIGRGGYFPNRLLRRPLGRREDKAKHIGIIGGADGPTYMFISHRSKDKTRVSGGEKNRNEASVQNIETVDGADGFKQVDANSASAYSNSLPMTQNKMFKLLYKRMKYRRFRELASLLTAIAMLSFICAFCIKRISMTPFSQDSPRRIRSESKEKNKLND